MGAAAFDAMFEEGSRAVREGRTGAEVDPAVSHRWGPSVILQPKGDVADALDLLTGEVLDVAGSEHWASGSRGAAHLTLRALERWGTPANEEQVDALCRAADGPVSVQLQGLTLTTTAVLLAAADEGGSADRLRARYAEELGAGGWLEDAVLGPNGRDLWYATLVHFAGPIADSSGLIEWVGARRTLPVASATFDAADLCEWRFDGRRMVPVVIATVPLR